MPQADTRHMYHSYRLDIINIIIIIIIIIISIIVSVVIIIVIINNTVRKRCFDRPILWYDYSLLVSGRMNPRGIESS